MATVNAPDQKTGPLLQRLSRKAGVIVGDDVRQLFLHAQEKGYAIPAIVSP